MESPSNNALVTFNDRNLNLFLSVTRCNAREGDVVYHMGLEFFGTVKKIFLDSITELPYYTVQHILDGKPMGSFPYRDFMTASRI